MAAGEGDRTAAEHAVANLADVPGAEVSCGSVADVLGESFTAPVDLVVLDPPREACAALVEQIVARTPGAVAYVACDPAALARGKWIFAEHGYQLAGLRVRPVPADAPRGVRRGAGEDRLTCGAGQPSLPSA